VDEDVQAAQIARLKQVKAGRDAAAVSKTLAGVERAHGRGATSCPRSSPP